MEAMFAALLPGSAAHAVPSVLDRPGARLSCARQGPGKARPGRCGLRSGRHWACALLGRADRRDLWPALHCRRYSGRGPHRGLRH